jgi:hypothetical protein
MIFLDERRSQMPLAPTIKCARCAGENVIRSAICQYCLAPLCPDMPPFGQGGPPPAYQQGSSGDLQSGLVRQSFADKPVLKSDQRLAWSWAIGLGWAVLILWAFYYLH